MQLTKGQPMNITKAATEAGSELKKLRAGAGWDGAAGKDIDLDLFSVYLGSDGKAIPDENHDGTNADEAVAFFQNLTPKGAKHSGDNRTGAGDGDDETIDFDLAAIPSNVEEVAIAVGIWQGVKDFSEVENAFVRLVNTDGDKELGKYELNEKFGSAQGVELGRLKRTGSDWTFTPSGTAIDGDDFIAVLSSYGVTGITA